MVRKGVNSCLWALAVACLEVLATPAVAEDTANVLRGVRWAGPAVSLEGLRGKTVVVLDYATWCPKCNAWSGELCEQLKAAIDGKPVVILAIDTDKDPGGVKQYLTQRGFFAPNIIHGHDPAIINRAGLPALWGYMIVDPAGKVVKKGEAGMFHEQGKAKKFVLAEEVAQASNQGAFAIIEPGMADGVKQALWPLELGTAPNGVSAEARRKLTPDQQKQVDAALGKGLDKQLAEIRKLAEGQLHDRLLAYDLATTLAARHKTAEQGKEARKVLAALDGDARFKRELAAKKAYEKCEKTSSSPARRTTALKTVAKRFEGTEYGEQAKKDAVKGG